MIYYYYKNMLNLNNVNFNLRCNTDIQCILYI